MACCVCALTRDYEECEQTWGALRKRGEAVEITAGEIETSEKAPRKGATPVQFPVRGTGMNGYKRERKQAVRN